MTFGLRFPFCVVIAATLGGCAAAPVERPETVDVRAQTLTPKYSSFNARVVGEDGAIEHTVAATLQPHAETFTRLESAYTQSVGEESLRLGDAVSSVGMWGSTVRYGGMQFGTQSRAREDVIASSQLALNGLAVLPTVEDALFASAGDAGSAFAGQNLLINRSLRTGGSDPWSLVARDARGRSESIHAPMIAATRLVTAGCADFSVGFGKVRRDYALASNEYGPVFANTTVACAAPLGLTVEGHGEYLAEELAALGVGVARQFGPLGTASVAIASSRADAGAGWLARIGFEHSNPLFNVMYRSRLQSREFREIGTAEFSVPVAQRDLASLGINVTDGAHLSLVYATQTTWERERTNLIALQQSLSLGQGALAMSAGHSLEDNFGSSVFISYKRPLGTPRPAPPSPVQELDLGLLQRKIVQ
jgi:outer membrane usher protein FimD/PapC